jgi:Amylo-alpha-1,6-glucosidase
VIPDFDVRPDPRAINLSGSSLPERTFLLGNKGGFVLYLPVAQNVRDRTLHAIKWFGASGFGRTYLEDNRVWIVLEGVHVKLDRSNQTDFVQEVDSAVLSFKVAGHVVRQSYFMPNRVAAFVMTLEADTDASFVVEPQFDMRYYQSFDDRFDRYSVEVLETGDQPRQWSPQLHVTNVVDGPGDTGDLAFYSAIASPDEISVSLLPAAERLRKKVYLKDELREKAIVKAYTETLERSPDEAPIWDEYETTVYAPAHISGASPLTICYTFGDQPGEAPAAMSKIAGDLGALTADKRDESLDRLRHGTLVTGREDVDLAYNHILMRFDNALVARNVKFHGPHERDHFNAIFAGNKYFLDAWKRDENIALIALLKTGDYGTVRAILSDTWQDQDRRTGRLPHIIRLGEPLVFFSSDGTLWALLRLWQYTRMTGDLTLLNEKYEMVERFFSASLEFVGRGLLPSGGIVDATYRWETWMDTPYTPRDGYPVEIELLWLTVLKAFLLLIGERTPELGERLEAVCEEGCETFSRFFLDGYLADSLGYDWEPRKLLTPNGYMAFGLGFPLPEDLQRGMIALARDQLAGRCGIRSLAPRDWSKVLSSEFLADPHNVRGKEMASVGIYDYHRGVEWLWLNQFFVAGELLCGDVDSAFDLYVKNQVHSTLHDLGVAGLSELYDMHGPLGADFQAWSMAGFVAALHHFAGVEVDAVDRRITARPCIPSSWRDLACRYQIGKTRFDLLYRLEDGIQEIDVTPVDHVPQGHVLRLGVRSLPGDRRTRVTVNGQDVSSDRIERVPASHGFEAWIELPFDDRVVATFASGLEA